MPRNLVAFIFSALFIATSASADNGMIHVRSPHNVADTTERLLNIIEEKGLTLFAQVDHAAGAAKTGQQLPPTRLVIFGNPKVGTPLMNCGRTTAIDLPQKMLIWEDVPGKVWLSYNNPAYLAKRHQLGACGNMIEKVSNVLAKLASAATQGE